MMLLYLIVQNTSKMKYNKKKYATGGDMSDILAASLTGLGSQALNLGQAINYTPQYDPTGNSGKFNVGNVAASALSAGLGPQSIVTGAMGAVAELIKTNKAKHTTVYGSPGQYATGGDMSLNSNAFQVNAPANRTDAKYYPEFNVNLDNNEVVDVKRKIVFSDDLKNPTTGNSFAEDAAKLERRRGEAEKKVKRYNDPFASNTMDIMDRVGRDLYSTQEALATLKGMRNNQGQTVQNHATGGPIDPNKPLMSIGGDYYYDPYNSQYKWRNPITGSYKTETGVPGFGTGQGFRPYAGVQGDQLITYPSTNQDKAIPPQSISNHLRQYPASGVRQYGKDDMTAALFGRTPDATRDGGNLPEVTINGSTAGAPTVPGQRTGPRRPAGNPTPGMGTYNGDADPYRVAQPIMPITDPATAALAASELDNPNGTTQPEYRPNFLPAFTPGAAGGKSATYAGQNAAAAGRSSGFTTGDYLQMGSAAASFMPLLQGPQRETPYLDNTQISKNGYDVNPQLYQSQRSFQNAANSIDTQSPNMRRAIENGLYAQKLNNDSQIVEKYQGMNNQAQQQYEARLSDRRRYNIGQTSYTNDLNRRNEGAYNTSLDNAFRTVGNFGTALNQRQTGQDTLALFKETYSDVYDRIINALTTKK